MRPSGSPTSTTRRGLNRPAVDLVRVYLDRLEAVAADAETQFPTVVG
jgi:hypothetical protein